MNICIANIRECNPLIGGVERVSYTLAHQWEQMGVTVILLSQLRMKPDVDYNPIVKQYYFPEPTEVFSSVNIEYVTKLFTENKIDIILNQSSTFNEFSNFLQLIKKNLSIPLVSSYHFAPLHGVIAQQNNFFIFSQIGFSLSQILLHTAALVRFYLFSRREMYRKEKRFYRELYRHSDAVVVLSECYLKMVGEFIGGDNQTKLFAIPNPITISSVTDIKIQPKKRQVLYVGRLEYGLKRVDRLIKIWDKLYKAYPQWELVIVGDGDYRYSFEKMVSDREIPNVRFEGFKEPEEYMSQAAILCMTSSTEGFGMVLVEAQQHGCVPIAYDSFGSVRDIIEDGKNGVLVKPFSPKEYVAKLRQLMDDEQLRQQMASNGVESVKRFDSQKIARQWIELFENIRK